MVDPTSATKVPEIKLLSADLLTPVMGALVAEFERTTKYRVALIPATTGEVTQRVRAGDSADVAIMQRPAMKRLAQEGKIIGSTIVDLGRSSAGVGVRAGAPKPDLTSVEGFIRSLLLAKSIGHTDPSRGGGSGVYFAELLERLGLAEQLHSKIRYPRSGNSAAEQIAEGEIDFGIAQPMEILAKREIELAGVLHGTPGPRALCLFCGYPARVRATECGEIANRKFLGSGSSGDHQIEGPGPVLTNN